MDLCALIMPYKTISIVGMCKNAGKTTVLNALVDALDHENICVALTSIGRDGERTDLVTGTGKPPIFIKKGTLIATAEQLLCKADITKEIVDTTEIYTPLGRVILVRALSDGLVELAGPGMTDQLRPLTERLFELGADKVIIDGAISRKSSARPAVSEAVILCTGAAYSPDEQKVIEDTVHAAELFSLKKHPKKAGYLVEGELIDAVRLNPDTAVFKLNGALTDRSLRPLIESNFSQTNIDLIVRDGSRILAGRSIYAKCLARGVRFFVENEVKLALITVNPSFVGGGTMNAQRLIAGLNARLNVPVCNVKENQDEDNKRAAE